MSTLKVNTVQHNTSGFNNVVQFTDGAGTENGTLCRAWVNFNGSGTVAIRDSFNVSSITDSGAGVYVVTMTNALANTNYVIIGNTMHLGGVYLAFSTIRDRDQSTRSTTQFQIDCLNSAGAVTDGQEIHIAVFGD